MIQAIEQNWVMLTVIGSVLLFVLPWVWVFKWSQKKKRILKTGTSKPAKIMRYKPSKYKMGRHAGSEFMQGVDLWLMVDDGTESAYEAKTRAVIHISEFSKIQPRMLITVKVDPHNADYVLVDKWHT